RVTYPSFNSQSRVPNFQRRLHGGAKIDSVISDRRFDAITVLDGLCDLRTNGIKDVQCSINRSVKLDHKMALKCSESFGLRIAKTKLFLRPINKLLKNKFCLTLMK